MGDIFGGIFDSLRTGAGSIVDFFDSGYENINGMEYISKVGEERLIESGWEAGSEKGILGGLGGLLSSGAGALLSSGGDEGSDPNSFVPMTTGQTVGQGRYASSPTKGTPSVDILDLERFWINRMKVFSEIQRETGLKLSK